jgi:hypothetical protein
VHRIDIADERRRPSTLKLNGEDFRPRPLSAPKQKLAVSCAEQITGVVAPGPHLYGGCFRFDTMPSRTCSWQSASSCSAFLKRLGIGDDRSAARAPQAFLPSDARKRRKFSRSSAMRSKDQTHTRSYDNSFRLGRTTRGGHTNERPLHILCASCLVISSKSSPSICPLPTHQSAYPNSESPA